MTGGHKMTLRQDRMAAYVLLKKSGSAVSTARTSPPEKAVILAELKGAQGQGNKARSEDSAAREDCLVQKTLPGMFDLSAREETNLIWARFCFGTGQ